MSNGIFDLCWRFEHDLPRSFYEHFLGQCADNNWNNPVAKKIAETLAPEIQYWASIVSQKSARLKEQELILFLKRTYDGALSREWVDKSKKDLLWSQILGDVFRDVFLIARGIFKSSEYSAVYFTDDYNPFGSGFR